MNEKKKWIDSDIGLHTYILGSAAVGSVGAGFLDEKILEQHFGFDFFDNIWVSIPLIIAGAILGGGGAYKLGQALYSGSEK